MPLKGDWFAQFQQLILAYLHIPVSERSWICGQGRYLEVNASAEAGQEQGQGLGDLGPRTNCRRKSEYSASGVPVTFMKSTEQDERCWSAERRMLGFGRHLK